MLRRWQDNARQTDTFSNFHYIHMLWLWLIHEKGYNILIPQLMYMRIHNSTLNEGGQNYD
jgi:hypothetical protein